MVLYNVCAVCNLCVLRSRREDPVSRRRQRISQQWRGRNEPVDLEVPRPCREREGTGEQVVFFLCLFLPPSLSLFLRLAAVLSFAADFAAAKVQQLVQIRDVNKLIARVV